MQGAIRPASDSSADFGSGFYMGDEITQPQTLICEAERICKQNRREGESFDEILERLCAEGSVAT